MVDLETKDRALKISWIQTIQEQEKIANLVYHSLNSNLKETIWLTNLHVSDVDMVIDESANTFWKDVLKAWSHINALDKIALWQPIWWNSLIRIGNKQDEVSHRGNSIGVSPLLPAIEPVHGKYINEYPKSAHPTTRPTIV